MKPNQVRPPREGLFRARSEQPEMRSEDEDRPTIFGHFARFNEWTEIRSAYEGHFMERISPGAFKKTFSENRESIKLLFQHGHDPQIGDKPLGVFRELREDDEGAYYEAELLDASYVRELIPGLRAGAYGASFRFTSIAEDFDKEPERSDHNPDGIPERTIREIRCYEGGPVTFPAYEGATSGVRSITDEVVISSAARSPEHFRELVRFFDRSHDLPEDTDSQAPGAAEEHSDAPPSAEVTHADEEGRSHIIQPSSEEFWSSLREKPDWEF